MSEFSLIDNWFSRIGKVRKDVELGVGDDAAIVSIAGRKICISVDTLVSGVHFPAVTSAEDIAYKSLAVNLSDMAAMGARPAWATLALSLTESQDDVWLRGFSETLDSLAQYYGVQLVGGDTTRSDVLTISIQIMGDAEDNSFLLRSGALPGDAIYVTGCIGDAGIGLQKVLAGNANTADYFVRRLNRPSPRVNESLVLKKYINAAIDISDGLIADLAHVLASSGCGASIELPKVPLSAEVAINPQEYGGYASLLTSGDDYELCFTVSRDKVKQLEELASEHNILIHCIGRIEKESGLRCLDSNGKIVDFEKAGFDHFRKG